MKFYHNGESYHATAGAGTLAAFGQANTHFAGKLPHPGAWMDGKPEPNECGGHWQTFHWQEGNFFD